MSRIDRLYPEGHFSERRNASDRIILVDVRCSWCGAKSKVREGEAMPKCYVCKTVMVADQTIGSDRCE